MNKRLCLLVLSLFIVVYPCSILSQEIKDDNKSSTVSKKSGQERAMDYYFSGNTKAKKANYKGAIDDYTKAINLDPRYEQAYVSRGLMKDQIQDYQGAIDDYNKAININTKNPSLADIQSLQIYMDRANLKIYVEDYDGAIEDYTNVVRLNPKYYLAYVARADTKYVLQDYISSLSDYNKAIEINPEMSGEIYYKRGNVKYILKRYEDAVFDYKEAINRIPNYQKAYYQLIGSFIFATKFDDALSYLEKYLEISDDKSININDFTEWNDCLNRYNQDNIIMNIKITLKKLKITI